MSTVIRSLMIKVGADLTDMQKNFKTASKELKTAGKDISAAGGNLTAGLTVPILGIGVALGSFVKDAAEAEKYVAQLDNVLESTGGAADVTRDQVLNLADALEKTTKFTAESTLEAQNLLLTFTNIGKDVFPETTKIALDMATALGTDAAGGAIQLGKALNDPTQGISALTRVGVSFTDAQKEQIKALQDSGDMMGAQKVILQELNKEFGGSAEAAGRTFTGSLEILKNEIGNVGENIGTALLPMLGSLIPIIRENIVPAIESFSLKIIGLLEAFKEMDPVQQNLTLGAIALATAIGPIITFAGGLTTAISGVVAGFGAASAVIAGGGGVMAALVAFLGPGGLVLLVVGAIAAAAYLIISNWSAISGFFTTMWTAVSLAFSNAWTAITLGSMNLLAWFKALPGMIVGFFNSLPNSIGYIIGLAIGNIIKFGLDLSAWIATEIPKAIESIVTFFSELPGKIYTSVLGALDSIKQWSTDLIKKVSEELPKFVTTVVDIFKSIPGQVVQIGKDIVAGLWKGISEKITWFKTQLTGFTTGITKGVKDSLGIKSPSKVMATQVGQWIPAGIAKGIDGARGIVDNAMENLRGQMISNSTIEEVQMGLNFEPRINSNTETRSARDSITSLSGGITIQINGAQDTNAIMNEMVRKFKRNGINLK